MNMDKIIDGKLYKKAKFLRTTCKNCRKVLPIEIINKEGKYCNKGCKKAFIQKNNKKTKKYFKRISF